MIPNFVQGNDFRLIVNITSLHVEEGEQVTTNFDITNCTDIHVYLTKLNNAAHCENKYEISYTLDDEHNNMIIADINEVYPVGSYGLEIIGISEIGEHWRFKARQGELFNIVDATSSANYTDNNSLIIDRYINLDAEIGVIGTNTGTSLIIEACLEKVDERLEEFVSGMSDYALKNETYTKNEVNNLIETIELTTGPQGVKGDTGDKGDTGPQGPQGEKGDKGDTGPQGPQGEKGDKGDTGVQGPKGDKGDKGDTGVQGPKGDKGDKGDTGEAGPKGDKGDTGEQGPKGDTGEQGPKGDKGDKGDTGEAGPKGDKGDKGDTGEQGPKGDKGDTGEQGPKGDTGAAFTYSMFTQEQLEALRGPQGPTGPTGPAGSGGSGSLEQVQVDWEEDDSTNVKYINNKPFYSESPITVDILSGATNTSESYYYYYHTNKIDEDFLTHTYDAEITISDTSMSFDKIVTKEPLVLDAENYNTQNNGSIIYYWFNSNAPVYLYKNNELIDETTIQSSSIYISYDGGWVRLGNNQNIIGVSYNGSTISAPIASFKLICHKQLYHKLDYHYIDETKINYENLKNIPCYSTDNTTDVIYYNTYAYSGTYQFDYTEKLKAGDWYTFIWGNHYESVKCISKKWGTTNPTTSLTLNVVDSNEDINANGGILKRWAVFETDSTNGVYTLVLNGQQLDNGNSHSYINGNVKLVKGRIIDNKLADYQNGSVIVEGEGAYSIKSVTYDRSTFENEHKNNENISLGKYSVCLGACNRATNYCSTVSGGYGNKVSGYASTVIGGCGNKASGFTSTVISGDNNISQNDYEVSGGELNDSKTGSNKSEQTLFTIGNGKYSSGTRFRHNAIEVRVNGDLYIPNTSLIGTEYDDNGTTKTYNESTVPMINVQNALLNNNVDLTNYYTKTEVNTLLENAAVGDVDLTSYAKTADIASTYATKAEVPVIWTGTQAEYDAITTKSETTIYIIK